MKHSSKHFYSFFPSLSYNMHTEFFNVIFTESSIHCPAQSQDLGFPVVLVQVLQDCRASKIKGHCSQYGSENIHSEKSGENVA